MPGLTVFTFSLSAAAQSLHQQTHPTSIDVARARLTIPSLILGLRLEQKT